MTTAIVVEDQEICIPTWVDDLASYRKWANSDEFFDEGRVCFIGGKVWIDTSMEQLFTHNQVKTELTIVLGGIAKQTKSGTYFTDGASLSNINADISTVPDGIFVKMESFEDQSLTLCKGAKTGFVELIGSPDMVLEIVSEGSVKKDKTELLQRYASAGISEYWVIDARKPPLDFTIYQLSGSSYEAVATSDGNWTPSTVFDKSFKLIQDSNAAGHPEFSLEVS